VPPIPAAVAALPRIGGLCHYRSFRWISISVLVANGQRRCPPRFGSRFDFCRTGLPFDEIINVPESGSKKIKETDVLVFAGFANAEKYQIFVYPLFCSRTLEHLAVPSERFYGMFGIVIVPRDVIVVQESEQGSAILFEAICDLLRSLTRNDIGTEALVKTINREPVLTQKSCLETMMIYSFHDRSDNSRKIADYPLEGVVIGVFEQIFVEVADKMDETFLLGA